MDELISIIVPVYNVEKFLDRCVQSLLNQTYSNLEIILIDDGSTDLSGKICDKYEKEDDRVKVLHSVNKGVSAARNLGIEIAKGKYIGFVDSDDFVEKEMFETLLKNMLEYDVELSMCNYNVTFGNKGRHHKFNSLLLSSKKDFFYYLCFKQYQGFLCNKLFIAKKIKDIKLDEEIKMLEDQLLITIYGELCEKFYYDSTPLYNYVMRSGATTSSLDLSVIRSAINAKTKILSIIEKYGENVYMHHLIGYFNLINILFNETDKKDVSLKNQLKCTYKKIINSQYITIVQKIKAFLNYHFYKMKKIIKQK